MGEVLGLRIVGWIGVKQHISTLSILVVRTVDLGLYSGRAVGSGACFPDQKTRLILADLVLKSSRHGRNDIASGIHGRVRQHFDADLYW